MKSPELKPHQTDSTLSQGSSDFLPLAAEGPSTRRTEAAYAAVVLAVGAIFLASTI